MKVFAVIVFSLVGLFACLLLGIYLSSRPPKEEQFIRTFYAQRAAFERLRDMLRADQQLIRLAYWGVATTNSVVPKIPPEGSFPLERYMEYMRLLKETKGYVAFRGGRDDDAPCIALWGSGWAGYTRHIGICWMDNSPSNQIPTLDGYRNRIGTDGWAFRHIDSNWYLWTDL